MRACHRSTFVGFILAASGLTIVAGQGPGAGAVPPSNSGNVDVSAGVGKALELSGLSANVDLGNVVPTEVATGAIEFAVATNNATGYTVAVSAAGAMTAAGISDTIPLSNLTVASGTATPAALTSPVNVITTTAAAKTPANHAVNLSLDVPFVAPGTYSTTLTVTATNNA